MSYSNFCKYIHLFILLGLVRAAIDDVILVTDECAWRVARIDQGCINEVYYAAASTTVDCLQACNDLYDDGCRYAGVFMDIQCWLGYTCYYPYVTVGSIGHDCVHWTTWSSWGDCTDINNDDCISQQSQRSRNCFSGDAKFQNSFCETHFNDTSGAVEYESCTVCHSSSDQQTTFYFGDWSAWSDCSADCDEDGTRFRTHVNTSVVQTQACNVGCGETCAADESSGLPETPLYAWAEADCTTAGTYQRYCGADENGEAVWAQVTGTCASGIVDGTSGTISAQTVDVITESDPCADYADEDSCNSDIQCEWNTIACKADTFPDYVELDDQPCDLTGNTCYNEETGETVICTYVTYFQNVDDKFAVDCMAECNADLQCVAFSYTHIVAIDRYNCYGIQFHKPYTTASSNSITGVCMVQGSLVDLTTSPTSHPTPAACLDTLDVCFDAATSGLCLGDFGQEIQSACPFSCGICADTATDDDDDDEGGDENIDDYEESDDGIYLCTSEQLDHLITSELTSHCAYLYVTLTAFLYEDINNVTDICGCLNYTSTEYLTDNVNCEPLPDSDLTFPDYKLWCETLPTQTPTLVPSFFPTSSTPTFFPSSSPVTFLPTRTPTTLDPTQTQPSQHPTTSLPTFSYPSDSPSQRPSTHTPTFSEPSLAPATSFPTSSTPSVYPTLPPSHNCVIIQVLDPLDEFSGDYHFIMIDGSDGKPQYESVDQKVMWYNKFVVALGWTITSSTGPGFMSVVEHGWFPPMGTNTWSYYENQEIVDNPPQRTLTLTCITTEETSTTESIPPSVDDYDPSDLAVGLEHHFYGVTDIDTQQSVWEAVISEYFNIPPSSMYQSVCEPIAYTEYFGNQLEYDELLEENYVYNCTVWLEYQDPTAHQTDSSLLTSSTGQDELNQDLQAKFDDNEDMVGTQSEWVGVIATFGGVSVTDKDDTETTGGSTGGLSTSELLLLLLSILLLLLLCFLCLCCCYSQKDDDKLVQERTTHLIHRVMVSDDTDSEIFPFDYRGLTRQQLIRKLMEAEKALVLIEEGISEKLEAVKRDPSQESSLRAYAKEQKRVNVNILAILSLLYPEETEEQLWQRRINRQHSWMEGLEDSEDSSLPSHFDHTPLQLDDSQIAPPAGDKRQAGTYLVEEDYFVFRKRHPKIETEDLTEGGLDLDTEDLTMFSEGDWEQFIEENAQKILQVEQAATVFDPYQQPLVFQNGILDVSSEFDVGSATDDDEETSSKRDPALLEYEMITNVYNEFLRDESVHSQPLYSNSSSIHGGLSQHIRRHNQDHSDIRGSSLPHGVRGNSVPHDVRGNSLHLFHGEDFIE